MPSTWFDGDLTGRVITVGVVVKGSLTPLAVGFFGSEELLGAMSAAADRFPKRLLVGVLKNPPAADDFRVGVTPRPSFFVAGLNDNLSNGELEEEVPKMPPFNSEGGELGSLASRLLGSLIKFEETASAPLFVDGT